MGQVLRGTMRGLTPRFGRFRRRCMRLSPDAARLSNDSVVRGVLRPLFWRRVVFNLAVACEADDLSAAVVFARQVTLALPKRAGGGGCEIHPLIAKLKSA